MISAVIMTACITTMVSINCSAAMIDPPKIGTIMDSARHDAELASYELHSTGFVEKVLDEAKVKEPTISSECGVTKPSYASYKLHMRDRIAKMYKFMRR